jgi:hypothetical protein
VDHNLAMECLCGVPTIPKVLFESVERIGRSGVGFGGVDSRVLFIPSCPSYTGLKAIAVRPLGVEKTSRLRSRDPMASGVKCGPHGGKNNKMKSWTVSWFSHKTKVETGLRGSRVMSDDWRRLHRVCGVSSGSPENH